MVKRVYCGKKTKIYIPKTVNPQIITYKKDDSNYTAIQNNFSEISNENIYSTEKRR